MGETAVSGIIDMKVKEGFPSSFSIDQSHHLFILHVLLVCVNVETKVVLLIKS